MIKPPAVPDLMQRIFIGIPLDPLAQQKIDAFLKPIMASQPDIRWVPRTNRHLTLAFLGAIPMPVAEQLLLLSEEAYRKERSFKYPFSALKRFPHRAGRIIALTGQAGRSLNYLHLSTLRLLDWCMIHIDQEAFRPHITLGRIKKPGQSKVKFDLPADINIHVTKIVIYKSTLTSRGSVYSCLKEIQLN